jgi:hypothetical protein
MIWATDQADAWSEPPTTMKALPIRMQFRRPSGMPMTETNSEQTAAARVYEDAIRGITYVPVGFCKRDR